MARDRFFGGFLVLKFGVEVLFALADFVNALFGCAVGELSELRIVFFAVHDFGIGGLLFGET